MLAVLRRLVVFARRRGLRRTAQRLAEELADAASRLLRGASHYELWFAEQQRRSLASLSGDEPEFPLISVIVPVCDPDPRWLRAAIDSVHAQRHAGWQLCLVDDASTRPSIRSMLREAANADARIEVQWNTTRQGIARTSNRALELARGEFVALLDHDDELTPDALSQIARAARSGGFDILYSDEDKIDPSGRLRDPTFKPDRCRDLLHACMYFGHLTVYRSDFLRALGGFDPSFDGSQDYELALRAEARAERVIHLPAVLYHWRMAEGSAANPDEDAKPWAYAAGRRAVEAAIARESDRARVVDGVGRGHARIVRALRPGACLSVIYCECCGRPEEAERSTTGRGADGLEIEWIPLGRGPSDESDSPSISVRWNEAADRASHELLVFLDGVRPCHSGTSGSAWAELAAQLQRADVGIVGARIRSERGKLLHAGAVLGGAEVVRTRLPGLLADEPGHLALAQSLRTVSAVTGGCFAIRRELLLELGGFDPGYQRGLHDVDLCLALRERPARVVYDPYVVCELMRGHERAVEARGEALEIPDRADVARLSDKWVKPLAGTDPCSSPSFHQRGAILHPGFRPHRSG